MDRAAVEVPRADTLFLVFVRLKACFYGNIPARSVRFFGRVFELTISFLTIRLDRPCRLNAIACVNSVNPFSVCLSFAECVRVSLSFVVYACTDSSVCREQSRVKKVQGKHSHQHHVYCFTKNYISPHIWRASLVLAFSCHSNLGSW